MTAATTARVGTGTESLNPLARQPVPRGGGEREEEELPEQRDDVLQSLWLLGTEIRELSGSSALGRGKSDLWGAAPHCRCSFNAANWEPSPARAQARRLPPKHLSAFSRLRAFAS